jgi:pyruvate,orthophosphate dikinase
VQKAGIKVKPEGMIPLVRFKRELDLQVAVVHAAAKAVMAEKQVKIAYLVGTMIEVPRGALTADEIAQAAEFFSFGTNDLTQTCLGMSRDDSGSLLLAALVVAEVVLYSPTSPNAPRRTAGSINKPA